VLLRNHRKSSGCSLSGRGCTAPWFTLIGTIYVVPTPKRGLWQLFPLWKGGNGGWCLSSKIMIQAGWCISPVANIWTKARCPFTLNSASSTTKSHFNQAGMYPSVNLRHLSGLFPILKSTVSFLGGLCFLYLVDPVEQTIGTACSSHWKDVTGIATVLYWM